MAERPAVVNDSIRENAIDIKLAIDRIEASVGMFYPGEDFSVDSKLQRMMTDIMHFAKKKDCDLPMILRGASMQFITELNLSQISGGKILT